MAPPASFAQRRAAPKGNLNSFARAVVGFESFPETWRYLQKVARRGGKKKNQTNKPNQWTHFHRYIPAARAVAGQDGKSWEGRGSFSQCWQGKRMGASTENPRRVKQKQPLTWDRRRRSSLERAGGLEGRLQKPGQQARPAGDTGQHHLWAPAKPACFRVYSKQSASTPPRLTAAACPRSTPGLLPAGSTGSTVGCTSGFPGSG